jgi:DNA-binding response OmpR family regulator
MTKKILLVDDDIDLVEQNKMILKEKGYEVLTSHTAKDALKLLESNKPDLIILDVMMEHRSAGFVFARELGKKYENIPVILLSGDQQKADWLGEDDNTWGQIVKFLEKPIKPDELENVIQKVLKNA